MTLREELEDVMNHKPWGHGKELMRKYAKHKIYTVTVTPYVEQLMSEVVVSVRALNRDDAQRQAEATVRASNKSLKLRSRVA